MPLSGFDKASSSINKRRAARQKASQLRTSKIKEAGNERDAFNKIATKGQKRINARRGSSSYRKSVLDAQPKVSTTPESLKKVKQSYIGYNPFGVKNAAVEKTVSSPATSIAKPKARAKAKAIKTVASKAAKLKVDVSNKLTPSVPKASSVEEYQKKGTMGKKKAPKFKVKASRRKQKGSKAATLKKGFGY